MNYSSLLSELEVNVALHDELIKSLSDLHEKTHLSQKNRPDAMSLFDEAFHASHAGRVAEICDYRNKGGKSIGTFCIYVPDEIALAAGVLPIPLCGGAGWSVNYADKALPRDICPIVRSTFGMALSRTCPYKKLKDFALGETTCDAKKKTWDLFGFKVLEVPQMKHPQDATLWLSEVHRFTKMMEDLSGVKVEYDRLKEKVELLNRKRALLNKINEFRKMSEPPVSGLDALLVSQTALNMDIDAFIEAAETLYAELSERADSGVSAYRKKGVRILMAGAPAPMGYAKVHWIAESSGLRVVADESCTGIRYFRDMVDETPDTLEGLIEAIADRYMKIDCSCFSPNAERIENVLRLIDEYKIDGVIHHILQYCHAYNIEARILDKELKKKGIPSLIIETDYSQEDAGQIRTRVEAFGEMIGN